jgi:glycosyltransferase involved in cell wall biosynthesis
MIIDHLNTVDYGGAAIAARRLHHALLASGIDSRFWASRLSAEQRGDSSYHLAPWPRSPRSAAAIWRRLRGKFERNWYVGAQAKGHEPFRSPRQPAPTVWPARNEQDRLLHLHWLAGLIDYASFFGTLPDDYPIVWTLHDLLPMTGGCHYSAGCEAFVAGCGNCPQLSRRGERDLSQRYFQEKLSALRGKNLHVVTPSRWLAREAGRSRMLSAARSVQVIPNGLDTAVFAPSDRLSARRQLGLPADRVLVAFGAASVEVRRKGLAQILSALALLPAELGIEGVVFGEGALPSGAPPVHALGYVSDAARQALVYSAADIVAVPSLEDNLPQTGVEALACGVPVVGFDVGGIPDFVRPGQTGLLARPADAADLARQIAWLAEHGHERLAMGHRAREVALREFGVQLQAQRYAALYATLLAERTCRTEVAA